MQIENQIKNSLGLLDSLKALTFGKGIALSILTGLATLITGSLSGFIGMKLDSFVIMALFVLASFAVLFYGVNAVGILNFQEAKGNHISIGEAVSKSLSTSHRLIGVFLLAFVTTLALMLVGYVALYLCKIPAIGPWLYGVIYPVGVLFYGLVGVFFAMVFTPLVSPSIWSGATVVNAFKTLIVMAKENIISIAIKIFLLGIIVAIVSGFIGTVVASGTAYMGVLTFSVFMKSNLFNMFLMKLEYGQNPLGIIFDILMNFFNADVGFSSFAAQSFGYGVIGVLSSTMVGQVLIRGFCLIYQSSIREGVDIEQEFKDIKVPEGLKSGLSKAKEVAGVVAAKAKEKGAEAAILAKEKAEELAKKAAEAKAAHDEKVRLEKEEARKIAEEERALEKERLALERQKEERLQKEAEEKRKLEELMPKESLTVICKKCNHKCSKDDTFCEECGSDL